METESDVYIIGLWNDWLKAKGLAEKTISEYTYYFEKIDITKIDNVYLLKWINKYSNPVARATLKNFIEFIDFYKDDYEDIYNKLLKFKIPKLTGRKKKKQIKFLTQNEVHYFAKRSHISYKIMILLSFYCGLRSDEILKIKPKHINFENKTIKITGKGNRERLVPVIDVIMVKLVEYLNYKIDMETDTEPYVFSKASITWRKFCQREGQRILGKEIHPHMLRHSSATYLFGKGLDLKKLKEFLGHSSISTTEIYAHIDKTQLEKEIKEVFTK